MASNIAASTLSFCCLCLLCFNYNVEGGRQPSMESERKSIDQTPGEVMFEKSSNVYPLKRYKAAGFKFNWAYYETFYPEALRGTSANLEVESLPRIQQGAMSSTAIRIYTGDHDKFTCIQAGWHVDPILYNDTKTHFFVHWTKDGYHQTGCFNQACEGYIQISKSFFPGSVINPRTVGGKRSHIRLKIIQENYNRNWWLFIGEKGQEERVGYWSDSLVPSLSRKETTVGWGSWVQHLDYLQSPPMGNSLYPKDGALGIQAAMISNILISYGSDQNWKFPKDVRQVVDGAYCCKIGQLFNSYDPSSPFLGYRFYYGGPVVVDGT